MYSVLLAFCSVCSFGLLDQFTQCDWYDAINIGLMLTFMLQVATGVGAVSCLMMVIMRRCTPVPGIGGVPSVAVKARNVWMVVGHPLPPYSLSPRSSPSLHSSLTCLAR